MSIVVVSARSAMRWIVVSTQVGVFTWVRATWLARLSLLRLRAADAPQSTLLLAFRLVVAALGIWSCSTEHEAVEAPPRAGPRPATDGYREVEVTLAGSIYGRITWVGERPPEVRASFGPGCGERDVEVLRVGPRDGVAGAVVALTGIHEGRPVTASTADLGFESCRLAPHVLAVGRGSLLRFTSRDGLLHNAHGVDALGASRFDLAVLPSGVESALRLDQAGIVAVRDDATAPGIVSWVHVLEHPYFSTTDESGAFRIVDVPAGRYTVMVWHEGVTSTGSDEAGRPQLGSPIVLSRAVTVVADQDSPADFQLDLVSARAAGAETER